MERTPAIRESHSAAAWGWFRPLLISSAPTQLENPTARQRGDRSSPFSNTSARRQIKNPTARQRVDRSSPFYNT
ncbi:MAG TPA: hypothetical protein VFD63_17505, partial [Pyrinomonadaceae bacterium]|nr:hypothetical protein [Pyrinomonadaceae bacterium]